ncbi:MAG: hypothetical protein ABS894_00735 [Aerococcus urinaeequi]
MNYHELKHREQLDHDPEIQKALRLLWIKGVDVEQIKDKYRHLDGVYSRQYKNYGIDDELPF